MNPTLRSVFVVGALVIAVIVLGLLISREGTITGAAVKRPIACYAQDDCNDRIAETDDICRNPGTEYSLCVNKVR